MLSKPYYVFNLYVGGKHKLMFLRFTSVHQHHIHTSNPQITYLSFIRCMSNLFMKVLFLSPIICSLGLEGTI